MVEDETEAPPTSHPEKAFTKEMRMAQAFSRFEVEFVDPIPQPRPNTRVLKQLSSQVREVGESTPHADID